MIPALERLVVGVPIHTIHNSRKLPSIDRFKDSAKSAIVKSHARPLCLDNQKAPVCIGPAGHALRHGESFPGQPCALAGRGRPAKRSEAARVRGSLGALSRSTARGESPSPRPSPRKNGAREKSQLRDLAAGLREV